MGRKEQKLIMQERSLFLCNSVYQVMVALWIKYTKLKDKTADIIISNHMNDGINIKDRISNLKLFENIYFVESDEFAKFKIKLSRKDRIGLSLFPNKELKKFVKLCNRYSDLYIANVDYFSQLLYDALAHKNPRIKLMIYEDGMFTYSKLYEKDYMGTNIIVSGALKKFIHKYVYRKKIIYGNVDSIFVFNPKNMMWNSLVKVNELLKISCEDKEFCELCNSVFGYYESKDVYDKEYIFMEESFFAEGVEINDIELLNQLSERVGKESIMVKIHPRNPINRFEKLGYKTNKNTSIPWEVILMNLMNIEDKKLITISSSSILNPILIFGKKISAYSLYELVNSSAYKSRLLSGDMWNITKQMFLEYKDMICICSTINDID